EPARIVALRPSPNRDYFPAGVRLDLDRDFERLGHLPAERQGLYPQMKPPPRRHLPPPDPRLDRGDHRRPALASDLDPFERGASGKREAGVALLPRGHRGGPDRETLRAHLLAEVEMRRRARTAPGEQRERQGRENPQRDTLRPGHSLPSRSRNPPRIPPDRVRRADRGSRGRSAPPSGAVPARPERRPNPPARPEPAKPSSAQFPHR